MSSRPSRFASITAVATLLLAGVVAGCAPTPPEEPTPREEALDAIRAYLQTLAEVGHDGGENPERLEAVASGAALEESLEAAESWAELGIRIEGTQSFNPVKSEVGEDSVEVMGCRDTTEWIFREADGDEAATSPGGPLYTTTYQLTRDDDHGWLVVSQHSEPVCPEMPIE